MLYDYYVAGKDENYICINQYFPVDLDDLENRCNY